MKIEATTDRGNLVWVDGVMTAPAAVLNELHKADPYKSYGLMPGVSLDQAYHYADSFLCLVQSVFPSAAITHDEFPPEEEDEIH